MSTDAVAFSSAHFGAGVGLIYLDNVDCSGNESNLTSCSYSSSVTCTNGHLQDAGVRCQSWYDRLWLCTIITARDKWLNVMNKITQYCPNTDAISLSRLTIPQVERKWWLECGWANQLVLSIYKLLRNLVWTPWAFVEQGIKSSWSAAVYVCGCYYTGEQADRESDLGIQSSFLPKSIDIACRVILNVYSGCLWESNWW